MRLGTDGGGPDPLMASAAFADIVSLRNPTGILKSQRGHVNVPSSTPSKDLLQNERYHRAQNDEPGNNREQDAFPIYSEREHH